MSELTLFQNRFGACNLSMPDGTRIKFANGMYYTSNEEVEKYLKELADKRQCGVFVDPKNPTVDSSGFDPMAKLKAQLRAEIEAERATGKVNAAAPSGASSYNQPNLANSTTSTMGVAAHEQPKVAEDTKVKTVPADTLNKLTQAKEATNSNSTNKQ